MILRLYAPMAYFRNFTDAENPVLEAFSTFFLIVALLSVIAIAVWFVLVVPNRDL